MPTNHYAAQLRIGAYSSYMYKAFIPIGGVIDGDTFDCMIDVGFRERFAMRVRIQGINAPELTGTTKIAGLASKTWLKNMLENKKVILRTFDLAQQTEKYGR